MEYKIRNIKFLSYFLLFNALYLIFIAHSFAENDEYLRQISENIRTTDKVKSIQALEELIEYQSTTPTLNGIKLIFSLVEKSTISSPSLLEKFIPRIKINDEIIQWFENDAIISPNSQIRLLALRIIGTNLINGHSGKIISVDRLKKFIYDPEEQIRIETIKYLAQINDTTIISLLSVSVNDGSYMVRKLVLETLRKYPYSPIVLDILLKRYPSESSLTLQFEMEEVIIFTVDSCVSGTDIILASLNSNLPEIRSLACRIIGKSLLIRNAYPDEKEKYIKTLMHFQSNDNEDVLASRIWALMKLCNNTSLLLAEFYKKTIFNPQYSISTRLFALDSFYNSASPEEKINIIKPIFWEQIDSSGPADWRLKSYW
ncbi:MAG: HEAT repeat domain-containing protein, partial [Planctomycetota bacterium]